MKRLTMLLLIFINILVISSCNVGGSLSGTIAAPTSEDDQQSYIEDLKIAGAYWKRYSSNAAGRLNKKYSNADNGYSYVKVENIDLNSGCGTTSDCNFLYESRTYDKSKAITNIKVIAYDKEQYSTWIRDEYNVDYYVVAGLRVNGLNSSTSYYNLFDVNKGGGGKYIYIYVTYDTKYEPITKIDIAKGAWGTDSDYKYILKTTDNSKYQSLNEGNGGDDLFLGISRAITGWEIYDLNLIDYDTAGNMETKVIKLDTKEKAIKEEYLQAFIDKGSYANFEGYVYNNQNSVNVGDPLDYNNITIYAKWTYNVVLDMSFFDQDNIELNNIKFTGDLPKITYKGYNVKGWKFKDETDTISTGLPLKHGGILEPVLERVHVQDYENFISGYEVASQFTEEYILYTMYDLITRNGSDSYNAIGFRCYLYTLNIKVDDKGIFRETTEVPTVVTSSIDYSNLSEDDKYYIDMHAAFLMMCSDDAINDTMDYFNNEGKSESIIDEVILDLCNKEIERRTK